MTVTTKTVNSAERDQIVKTADRDEATVLATRKARLMNNTLERMYPLPAEFRVEVRA